MSHCIPIHLVCDSIEDCSEAADEKGCSNRSCPGLLYCREDDICVHPLHICDGVVDCMLSVDDEAFCDVLPCPPQCQCQSYAVYCTNVTIGENTLPTHSKILIFEHVKFQDDTVFGNLQNLFLVHINNVIMPSIFPVMFLNLNYLTYLNLANNSITLIRPHSFKSLASLKSLKLESNQITTLQEHAFDGLFALVNLDLNDLYINQIEQCTFCIMKHLKTLNLSGNKLTNLNGGMFKGMPLLETLDLSRNDFRTQTDFTDRFYRKSIIFHVLPYCCTMRIITNCHIPSAMLTSEDPSCQWITRGAWYNILCCCIAIVTVMGNLLMCYYLRTEKHKSQYILQNTLQLVNTLPMLYCVLLAWVHYNYSTDAIYLLMFWAHTNLCQYFKVANVVLFLLSNYIHLINAVNVLILTRFTFVRAPLSLREICTLLGVGASVATTTGIVWIQLLDDQEPLCFPLMYGKSRVQDIAIVVYMVLNLLVVLLIPMLYRYIGVYVSKCAERANQRKSSRGLTEHSIVMACSLWLTWAAYNVLNWMDVILKEMPSADLKFVLICVVLSSQSHLCWIKYLRKILHNKKRL